MSRVSVSLIASLLRRDARAFLAERLDRALVLALLVGNLVGRLLTFLGLRILAARAVARILGHLVLLVLGHLRVVLVVLADGHDGSPLERGFERTTAAGAPRSGVIRSRLSPPPGLSLSKPRPQRCNPSFDRLRTSGVPFPTARFSAVPG